MLATTTTIQILSLQDNTKNLKQTKQNLYTKKQKKEQQITLFILYSNFGVAVKLILRV